MIITFPSPSGIFYGSWWLFCWQRMCGMMSTHGLFWSICSPVVCTHWPPAVPIPSVLCLLVPDISSSFLTMGLYLSTVSVRDTQTHTRFNGKYYISSKFKDQSPILIYMKQTQLNSYTTVKKGDMTQPYTVLKNTSCYTVNAF